MGRSGEILFEDGLGGEPADGWRVAPERFVEHPEHGAVYLLEAKETGSALWDLWAGNGSWRNYRLEVEMLPTGEGQGFLGLDFHVQDDGIRCCNLHFVAFPENEERQFEGCGRWSDSNTSWKLGPLSQRTAPVSKGEWFKFRLDVADTFANLYVDDAAEPCFTIYDLPFPSGGVRLWSYYASAYVRNLRVTELGEGTVAPVLEDVWGAVADRGLVRAWEVSQVFPEGFGADDPLGTVRSAEMNWRTVEGDRRGVVNVGALGPEYLEKGVVFVRASVESSDSASRACRLTYTDRLTLWCNEALVFEGEARGWNDPGRSAEDGWGRLMPDQFGAELPPKPGANVVVGRFEVNEPFFGSGFWMRLE